jgi:hypothetical protein
VNVELQSAGWEYFPVRAGRVQSKTQNL